MSGLVLQNVVKEFGSFTAVKGVDLEVPNGTFVCLLGPSGCGKTTLLRMIAGLDLPTHGAIRLGVRTSRRCRRTSAIWAWCSSRWRCFRI